MLKAIARIVRTPDLLRKIAFTLALIAVYRMGAFVPAPGVDYPAVQQCLAAGNAQGGLYSFVNMFSGGALLQVSVFALGIMPYITASIITQLLRVVDAGGGDVRAEPVEHDHAECEEEFVPQIGRFESPPNCAEQASSWGCPPRRAAARVRRGRRSSDDESLRVPVEL